MRTQGSHLLAHDLQLYVGGGAGPVHEQCLATGDPAMVAAESLFDGDDVVGGQELLFGGEAAPADLKQRGGLVTDVAVPVAFPQTDTTVTSPVSGW